MATQLILLTATLKNGVAYTGQIAVDVSDITKPVTAVSAGVSLVTVRKNYDNNITGDNVNVDVWTVSHSLAAIATMDATLLVVAVTNRVSAVTVITQAPYLIPVNQVFYLPAIVGPVEAFGAAGSKFLYHEQGNPSPVLYYTNVTPAAFVAGIGVGITGNITVPFIPYASAAGILSDSWLQRSVGGIQIATGKTLSTSTAGQTQMGFGVGGDNFDLTTDGGLNVESRLLMNPTSFSLSAAGNTNYLSGSVAGVGIYSTAAVTVISPLVSFSIGCLLQSSSVLSTVDLGAAGDEFSVTTDNQAYAEGYLRIRPTNVLLGLAGSGLLAMNPGNTTLSDAASLGLDGPAIGIGTVTATAINLGSTGTNINMIGSVNLSASVAARASMNIAPGVAPTVPVNGDFWYNGTDVLFLQGATTETVAWLSDVPVNASGVFPLVPVIVSNLDTVTGFQCQYLRLGNTITVSGKIEVNPTLTATVTQVDLNLPVASNFGAEEDCGGVAFARSVAGQGAEIYAEITGNKARMQWTSTDVTNQPMSFTFTYRVI